MSLIKWDDSMSVNVAEIDRQHQELIMMINDLYEAMSEGKGKKVLRMIMRQLINYTEIHFETEEILFDKFAYPEADSHKKEHANFVQKISTFQAGIERGQLGLSIEIMKFLSNWLEDHIMKTDKRYSQLFNENGLR